MAMTTKTSEKTTPDDELKLALESLETSLATPVVSGELADWLEAVQKTWAEASAQIDERIEQRHPAQIDEIGKADPELLPRVEQLQEEDAAIKADADSLRTSLERSAAHLPKLEPDEEKAQQHLAKFIDEGMALIARVRKQEVAIQTWYFEAFNRDRGAVD
jgi:chromosome segregation ATPase